MNLVTFDSGHTVALTEVQAVSPILYDSVSEAFGQKRTPYYQIVLRGGAQIKVDQPSVVFWGGDNNDRPKQTWKKAIDQLEAWREEAVKLWEDFLRQTTVEGDPEIRLIDDVDQYLDVDGFFRSVSIKGYASFNQWASAWFTPDRLDCFIPGNVVYWSVMRLAPQLSHRHILTGLKAWCGTQGYEFNPLSLQGNEGRILRRGKTYRFEEGAKCQPGQWISNNDSQTQAYMYIRTSAQAELTDCFWTPNSAK